MSVGEAEGREGGGEAVEGQVEAKELLRGVWLSEVSRRWSSWSTACRRWRTGGKCLPIHQEDLHTI